MTVSEPVRHPGAAQRWLEIVGEASAGLSDEFKDAHAEVAWRDLVGMRKILAHGYFHVDDDLLWVAVERDVPLLLSAMKAALHPYPWQISMATLCRRPGRLQRPPPMSSSARHGLSRWKPATNGGGPCGSWSVSS